MGFNEFIRFYNINKADEAALAITKEIAKLIFNQKNAFSLILDCDKY